MFAAQILMDRGYEAEFRGSIAVKGKGEMKTYFVVGKKGAVANNLSRQSSQISSLATVVYGMVQARRRQNTVKKRHSHRECASTNNTNSYNRGKQLLLINHVTKYSTYQYRTYVTFCVLIEFGFQKRIFFFLVVAWGSDTVAGRDCFVSLPLNNQWRN